MSTTLTRILTQLPAVLQQRYDAVNFWVEKANQVMIDVELEGDFPAITADHCMPLVDDKFEYRLPAFVKKVHRIWKSDLTTLQPRKSAGEIPYEQVERRIRIPSDFLHGETRADTDSSVGVGLAAQTGESIQLWIAWSAGVYAVGDIVTHNGELYSCIQVTTNEEPGVDVDYWSEIADDAFRGYIINFTSGLNEGYTRIIEKSYGTGFVRLVAPFYFEVAASDIFTITNVFVTIRYTRGFEEFVDTECEIDIEDDLAKVLVDGLRFYGEWQTDEEGEFTLKWEQRYRDSLRKYVNRRVRSNLRQAPRFTPTFGKRAWIARQTSGTRSDITD